MKISKEIKAGIISLAAIGLLVAGVNFLKGNSFFGGDDAYYAYFPNSGGIAPASSVVLNGVGIGKILSVENTLSKNPNRQVRIKFSVQNDNIKIPKGSAIEIGALDLFSKGLVLELNPDISQGFYKPGDSFDGIVAVDMFAAVKAYADPVSAKLQKMMEKVDKLVASFSSFWDTTATTELEGSMHELKMSISRFGDVAEEVENLIVDEKQKLGRIMDNVESITHNLKLSNEKITKIFGNVEKISADLVSADFKTVVANAELALGNFNTMLAKANSGEGSLGKLLKDEALYNELIKSNKDLQELIADLEAHPERYIHISLFKAKTKGVPLTSTEEKKLHEMLDNNP